MSKKQIAMLVLIQDLMLAFVINTAATILNGGFQTTALYLVGYLTSVLIEAPCQALVKTLVDTKEQKEGAVQ